MGYEYSSYKTLIYQSKGKVTPVPKYSETSIHRIRQGSEKETMDPGKQ
jgi:hypothetical protein